jgi:hypothetical protein
MGQTEITYGEWRVVKEWADRNRYSFDNEGAGNADNYPVTNINWYDVVKWSNAKSERDGLTPVYYTDPGQTEWSVYRTRKVSVTSAMVNWKRMGIGCQRRRSGRRRREENGAASSIQTEIR